MARENIITVGCRVKGAHGEFLPNPKGHRRRIRAVITGKVVKSVGYGCWAVRWDRDGTEKDCKSRSLKVIHDQEGIPVNEVPQQSKTNNSMAYSEVHIPDVSEEPALNDHESDIEEDEELFNGDWDLGQEMLQMLDESETNRHQTVLEKSWDAINKLEGEEVALTSKGKTVRWTVVSPSSVQGDPDMMLEDDKMDAGLLDDSLHSDSKIHELFLELWPGDLFKQLENLNMNLVHLNRFRKQNRQRIIKDVSKKEILTFIALIIAASSSSTRGFNLWSPPEGLINTNCSYNKYMKLWRFKEIKMCFSFLFWDKEHQKDDPWWKFRAAVSQFTKCRQTKMKASKFLVFDESMSALVPRTT